MINLGPIDGGMKLFFTESLSGVINWSLAAPVFGVNYFILAALIDLQPVAAEMLAAADRIATLG